MPIFDDPLKQHANLVPFVSIDAPPPLKRGTAVFTYLLITSLTAYSVFMNSLIVNTILEIVAESPSRSPRPLTLQLPLPASRAQYHHPATR